MSKRRGSDIEIPMALLAERKASILEIASKFLIEIKGLNFHDAGATLNRDERTIWTCFSRAQKKFRKQPFAPSLLKKSKKCIPASIFHNRTFSSLETICIYLIDTLKFNYHDAGALMQRDERTIWTCYHRAKAKEVKA